MGKAEGFSNGSLLVSFDHTVEKVERKLYTLIGVAKDLGHLKLLVVLHGKAGIKNVRSTTEAMK